MRFMQVAALAAFMALSACAAKPVTIVSPVAPSLRNASMISDVEVTLSPLARTLMDKFEAKAAEKRANAGLPAANPSAELTGASPEHYDTLPFAQMFELVVKDVARESGLLTGRPLRVQVEIDTLKTADAGMTILAGSSDQLAGQVSLLDARTGEKLGDFYVDVINAHSGLMGLALRGGGVREKLAHEFAGHIAKQLTGKGK